MKHTIRLNGNRVTGRRLLSAFVVTAVLMALPMGLQSKDKKGSKSVGFVLSQDATPKEVGLPAYPGAQRSKDTSDDSSALQMGAWGGDSGFKLVLLKLDSSDSPEKIATYYRKALAKYGAVLDCGRSASKHARGQKNELSCDDDTAANGGFVFKSGTQREQHVVGIEPQGDHTRISLVYVETPESSKAN
jgi:hypothetical protein